MVALIDLLNGSILKYILIPFLSVITILLFRIIVRIVLDHFSKTEIVDPFIEDKARH